MSRKKLPRQQPASAVSLSYYSYLKGQAEFAHELIKRRVITVLPALLEQTSAVDDARLDAGAASKVTRLFSSARAAFTSRFPVQGQIRILNQFAIRAAGHQKDQLAKQVKAGIGIDLGPLLDKGLGRAVDHFTASNVSLIRSIPERYFSEVEGLVLGSLREGERAKSLAADIEDRFEVTKSRVQLIARDQVSKFQGDLNRTRQTNLGVSRYTWRTMEDERVREEHDALDGEEFDWDDPPDEGHPSDAVNCRCWADPILDDLLGDEEEEAA